jgi:hypothetical protein
MILGAAVLILGLIWLFIVSRGFRLFVFGCVALLLLFLAASLARKNYQTRPLY